MSAQEMNTCSFCRAETSVTRQYLRAKNKPMVGDGFTFVYYCSDCGLRETILDSSSRLSRREALLEVKCKAEDVVETCKRLLKIIEE